MCWDGSTPDVATDPDCTCPERKVEFSLNPEEDTRAFWYANFEEVVDWPDNVSINNPVNKVCWGPEQCEFNAFTADGDMLSHLTPE